MASQALCRSTEEDIPRQHEDCEMQRGLVQVNCLCCSAESIVIVRGFNRGRARANRDIARLGLDLPQRSSTAFASSGIRRLANSSYQATSTAASDCSCTSQLVLPSSTSIMGRSLVPSRLPRIVIARHSRGLVRRGGFALLSCSCNYTYLVS